jgi:diguanylate cyclase (GGDEF)-like protein
MFPERRDSTPLTVLAVDDDRAVLRLIAKIAGSVGYRVIQAQDGHAAWKHVLEDGPDILVTDWDMPGLNGLQLCRKLREDGLPFYVYALLLTAKSRSEEMCEGLDAGADDFICKPIDPAVLLARLKAGARTVAMERRLRDFARSDPLTGVMNRRAFHEHLALEWERAGRYQRPLSCVMIDLDFFKKVNDTYGHMAGDAVLQGIAHLLEDYRRASDALARFGGEEFCVLLSETEEAGAVAWADRVRLAIAEARIPFTDQVLCVTGSLGVAARAADTTSPEALVALADQALRAAKESGRNRVVAFSTLADRGPDSPDHGAADAPWAGILVRDVMAPAMFCPNEHDTLEFVANLFLQLRLNAAPVVDDAGALVGIVSEDDLLAMVAGGKPSDTPIRECMKTNVVQYDEQTPAKEVFRFLDRASVPGVAVVSQACLTGVISRASLLRWLRNWSAVHQPSGSVSEPAPLAARGAGILKAAAAASDRLQALRTHLAHCGSDFVPCVVAEATRLEDLVRDLLAHCSA